MTRPLVDVRRANPSDTEELLLLWAQAREESGGINRALLVTSPDQLRPRLCAALGGDDVQVLLARWDGRAVGYAVVRAASLLPIVEDHTLHVEHLFVMPALRRHGVARQLLAAVASVAERHGAEQVVISAPPSARETHRFLARLGFTPVVVRRVVSTALLRRRLVGEGRRSALEDLLSRRRSLRARSTRERQPEAELEPVRGRARERRPVPAGSGREQDPADTLEMPAVDIPVALIEDGVQRA